MSKLFLIDAYALIYRSYYALINNPSRNSKGQNTSAILGFCNTLNEVLRKEEPDYLGVAFDHGKTFRHEAFPAYKAQREATPEDIRFAVPWIKKILQAMQIPILQVDGFEADDIIGTLSHKAAEQEGLKTYMLTPDKDYAQLVRPNVFMYKPGFRGGYDVLGEAEVDQKYQISSPQQVIDLLALMGDSSDNYPGCPGVGEKTAAKLIAQFGSVEQLLDRTSELKGKMKEKVEAAVDDIKMSKFLATIRTDVPIELNLDDLKVKEPNAEELTKIFQELEFRQLLKRMLNKPEEPKKIVKEQDLFSQEFATEGQETHEEASFSSLKSEHPDYHLVDSEDEMLKIRDYFRTFQILSLDTETTSVNTIDAELVGLSFAVKEKEAFYVPIPANREEAQRIVNIFKSLYEDPKILKVGQNIKYDFEVLIHYGVCIAGPMFDTMLAHYIWQPELQHNMDYMAETLLHYKTVHIDELIGPKKGKQQRSMRDLDPKDVYEYAAEDADITLRLKNVLEPKLREVGGEQLFTDVEMPLMPVLADMELTGVRLDLNALGETAKIFNERMVNYQKRIYEDAGEQFNISSPKQVGDILFGKMHLMEKPKKTKTGQYVTSEDVLERLRPLSPVVDNILNYRGMKKLLSTYVEALPKLINPRTGHIHTSFNQALTATGRLSSSDPNLQNIPVRTDDGKEIRRCFIPEEGCKWFSADYSQIELRIMAHLSGDENMIEAFKTGQDIHRATAARIWHLALDEVSDAQRKKAKQANFGIIYGITAFGLAQRMEISNTEARELIDNYFKTFPRVKAYMDESIQRARKLGYAETLFHRRRYLPDINSGNGTVRGFAERNAINAPIQGTEADIIKMAMIAIHRRFQEEHLRSKMILQVHDELNFNVVAGEEEIVEKIVLSEMQGVCTLSVPLIADAGWGTNWLEAH